METLIDLVFTFCVLWVFYKIFFGVIMGIDKDDEYE